MKVLDLSYHPSDVRSGGWVDLSRKGNHGVPHGGARPFQIAPGVMGFEFDGSSGYVEVPDNNSLDITGRITVAAWVRVNRLGVTQQIVGKHDKTWIGHAAGGYILELNMNDRFRFSFSDGIADTGNAGAWDTVQSDRILSASDIGKWCYVVGAWDGTTIQDGMHLYINSVLDNSAQAEQSSILSNDLPLSCGGYIDSSDTFKYGLSGVIAQPIIEDRAWSEAEVRENMYRSPVYRMLRGLPHSQVYIRVPWKQTQGGIYVP